MSRYNSNNLKRIMLAWQPGMVATYNWLENYGVYPQLVDRYVKSGWLERLAPGVFIKPGDKPLWAGIVDALQLQYPGSPGQVHQ